LYILKKGGKAIKASNILFGNATADDLKELDEATFLEVLMAFLKEIVRDEIEESKLSLF
jgi:tyrosyl-tRNA synthetase